MKKLLLTTAGALLSAGLLLYAATAPAETDPGTDTPTEEYPVNAGKDAVNNRTADGDRHTEGFIFTSPAWGEQEVTIQQAVNNGKLYFDLREQKIKCAPGETLATAIKYYGSGMCGFVYIDLDGNKQFDFAEPTVDNWLNGELVSYSQHNFNGTMYNSTGATVSGAPNCGADQRLVVPGYVAPSEGGEYVMRVKVDWNVFDPAGNTNGNNAITLTSGCIMDITLEVEAKADDTEWYTVNAGKDATHNSNRAVTAVQLTSSYGSQSLAVSQGSPKKLYNYLSDKAFVASAGETVTAGLSYNLSWMGAEVYIDKDNDGQFDWLSAPTEAGSEYNVLNGDLMSFWGYNNKDSKGAAVDYNGKPSLPSFTIPAEMTPGMYRIRYKLDWDNLEPGGNRGADGSSSANAANSILKTGGCIVDVPLIIVGESNTPVVTIEGTATGGTVAVAEGANLVLTPETGYTVGTLTAKAVFTDHGYGNPTEMSFTFSGSTIPAAALVGESVTVDVTNAFVQIPSHDGYTLVWNDEFNTAKGSHPDMEGTYGLPQKQSSTWNKAISARPELMEMDGQGNMVMTAKQIEGSSFTNRWETGAIQTAGHFATKYGRIEARLKTAKLPGTFPAFWMMPVDNRAYVVENGEQVMKDGWPYGGEMDIYETVEPGNPAYAAYATVHGVWSKPKNYTGYSNNRAVDVSQYHIYTLEWDEEQLRFYIDKEQNATPVHTVTKGESKLEGSWPFDKEFYVILNQSIGGNADYSGGGWPGLPTDGNVYTTDVDWVRVYQKNDLLAPVVTFVDAEGNALAEQPATITAGETLTAKVETSSTATITVKGEGVTVIPVEGNAGLYSIAVSNDVVNGSQVTVQVTANYPSGTASEPATVSLTFDNNLTLPEPLKLSTETESHWYTFSNVNNSSKCAVIAADDVNYPIHFVEKADADTKSYWKITRHTDGGFNIVSYDGKKYISGDALAANDRPFGVSEPEPDKSFEIVPAFQNGEFIIRHRNHDSAASAYFNYGNGKAESGNMPYLNSWHNHGTDLIDGVCQFGVKQRKPGVTFTFGEVTSQITKAEGEHYSVKVQLSGAEEWHDVPATVDFAQSVKIRVEPEEGYKLVSVTVAGVEQTMSADAEAFEMNTVVTGNVAVSATAELKTYTVSWTPAHGEEAHYDVEVKKRDTDEVLPLPATVEHGTVLNIVITPHEGYRLTGALIGDEVKTSENLEDDGTFVAVPSVQSDMVIREVTAELKKYNVSVIPTEGEEAHYTVTMNMAGGDTELTQPAEVAHGTEIGITIAPEEGYRLTAATVDGQSLGADDLQADGNFVVITTVTADVAVSNVTVELINREPAVEVQAPTTEGVATEVGEGENKEDKPVFYEAPNDNVKYAVITFHHNSEIESVELPAIVTEPVGKGEGEFVVEHEDATIATGELDLENAKLVITRRSKVGSTMLTILWRPTNLASRAEGDIELAKVLVNVITPGNAAPALTNKSGMVTLYLGQSATPMVAVEPAGIANALRYESTNPAVATVDPATGLVAAVAVGNCEILVTMEGIEGVLLRIPVVAKNATGNPGQGVSGIEAVNADAAEGRAEIYDLAGRRLTRVDAAGIYIVNGIKTVVR